VTKAPDGTLPATGTWCCELELSGDQGPSGVTPLTAQASARVLVRLHGDTLGYLTTPVGPSGLDVDGVVAEAARRFASRIEEHLRAEGLPAGAPGPRAARFPEASDACPARVVSDELVTVVVCTRNRSDILVACLDRLRALTYPHLDVLVVDNAPSDDSTQRVVEAVAEVDPRFRYVREPRPGLSSARNCGLREARGTYLAYTDDDVAVDPDWVQGLLHGFARRDDVGCVTGLVATAGISNAAEEYFDARAASWSTRAEVQVFDLRENARPDALYPYSPGIFGTGANFAFDREFLLGLGGFDEALGAGTATRGGEDLDIFVRVLRAGRSLVYDPSSVVWHHHRADRAALLSQMFGYGTGLSAFVSKCLLEPGTRWEVLRRIPLGVRRMAGIRADTTARLGTGTSRPDGALAREFLGFAAGPLLYLRARRAVHSAAAQDSQAQRVGVA
jgi:glycosyltransferase involved in cell wall biosynthesis